MLFAMTHATRKSIGILLAFFTATTAAPADVWSEFVARAAAEHGEPGRAAAEFLAKNRPPRDADLTLDLLETNLRHALRARREFPWARTLSDAQFHNDVLPYATLDETRESWRPEFYEKARAIVAGCATAGEAAQALNAKFFHAINVHYNTGRKSPNQSPSESIAQGRATCTGLSIILVDACRAVGVPARIAGIPNWVDKRGNHTWVEVWDGRWFFTGADEHDPAGLDRAWFVDDARKAIPGHADHAIWATSWASTGRHFPMSWNPNDQSVPAVDVTERYAAATGAPTAERALYLRVWDKRDGQRCEARVDAVNAAGEVIGSVTTRAGNADLNDMPALNLPHEASAALRVTLNGITRCADALPSNPSAESQPAATASSTLDLYWNELGLSEAEAESLVQARFRERAAAITADRAAELAAGEIRVGEHRLRLLERTFGAQPADGRSLWISMHGGGNAPREVNDRQWQNQLKLYEPAEGIYVAPRAPTDTWTLWHEAHVDPLFDRLIETLVAARHVNPNRVYLLGYSAGGDGVFQLAPRIADRLAAASMMAGHPNETQPLGLRNLPFAIFMGGDDAAYNRNQVAADWREQLAKLRAADPEGYPHRVTIYEGLGHWMNGRDAEVLPWMAQQQRVAWPRRVVWCQDDVTHTRFYWLAVAPDAAKPRATLRAGVNSQTITIDSAEIASLTLRLRDALLDLDQPITVIANGKEIFRGTVKRTLAAIESSLAERNDPFTAATALLQLRW